MVQTLQKAGTILRAFYGYFSEEKKEDQKIREKGIRKYIEDYKDISDKHLTATL